MGSIHGDRRTVSTQSQAVDPDIAHGSNAGSRITRRATDAHSKRFGQKQWVRMGRDDEALAVADRIDEVKQALSSWS